MLDILDPKEQMGEVILNAINAKEIQTLAVSPSFAF